MKTIKITFPLIRRVAGLCAAIFLTQITSHAATFIWTNTVGGNWSNPNNWSPNLVPGQPNAFNSTDDVLITNAGTYTVVLDEGTTPDWWDIRSLTLGGASGTQTLAMTNKILYVAPLIIANHGVVYDVGSDFHATITVQNGGALLTTNGSYFVNPFIVNSGGTFTTHGNPTITSAGALEMAGALNIADGNLTLQCLTTNSGTMTVSNGAGLWVDSTLTLLSSLTNAGTLTLENNGAISISNNLSTLRGGIVNLAGGVVNLNNAKGITGGNNHEFLVNHGTINSASGGGIQAVPGFTNSGAIYVTANTLDLDSGLHLQSSGSLNVQLNSASSYGKIAIAGSAALAGAFNVTLGNSFNPQNGNSFQPVTYSAFSGNFTSTNLPPLVPWQLAYDSAAVTLTVTTRSIVWTNTLGGNWSDPNNWSPNIVPGSAIYGNDDDAVITAPGTYTVIFDEGTIAAPYYLHGLTLGSGSGSQTLLVADTWPDVGTMSVNDGGSVNSSGNHWFNNWVAPLMINDRGFFNSTNDLFDQNVTVSGGGNFNVVNSTNGNGALTIAANGALKIPSGALVLKGAATNSGTITVSGGASLSVNGNLALVNSGYLGNQSGGTIAIRNGHGITGDNGAEILSNQGEIISSGGYIQSVPNFQNAGSINAATGTLALDSGLQLQSSGSLNVQLNSASDYGKIAIAGNAALNGAFGVTLNYSPNAGDSFTPLTYDSYSGNFSSLNLPMLGTGQSWQSALGATALTLQIAETVTWTNTAGGNWSDPNNWNPNQVPGQFDDVGITAPGTYTVVMDPAMVDIRSLTLGAASGAQTLAMTNKTLYVNPMTITGGGVLADSRSTFHAAITVGNGGQLDSTSGTYYVNPLTIANGGQMTAYGYYVYGAIVFHGNVVVDNGGAMTIPASGGYTEVANDGSLTVADGGLVDIPSGRLFLYGPMTNSGTVNLTGGGSTTDIGFYNNGTANERGFLLNLPNGTINLNGNGGGIDTQTGPNSGFINQGAIISSGSSHNIRVSDFDNHAGVVTNLYGTLGLSTFTNTLAGTFYATNGTIIQFSGGTATNPLTPGNPLTLTGGGQFQFVNYGNFSWLDLTNDIIPNLQLVSGYLELEPTFQGGVITNLALNGITLTNAPGVVWAVTNGTFAVTNSAVYGDFNVENGGQLTAAGNSGTATFHGDVTVAAGGLLTLPQSWAEVASSGSLTVDADGTMNIQGGAYLQLQGPLANSGAINLLGNNGSVSSIILYNGTQNNYLGGIWNLPGGTMNFDGVANGYSSVNQNGANPAPFINQGAVVVNPGSAPCSISAGIFDNSAGVVTNLAGTLPLGAFTNTLAGTFYAAIGSTIQFIGGTASTPLKAGSPLALLGGGRFQFTSGWLDLPADVIPNLQLVGGFLELEPAFQNGAITNLALNGITLTNSTLVVTNGIFAVTSSAVYGDVAVKNGGQLIAAQNGKTPTFYGNVTVESGGLLTFSPTFGEIANGGSLTVAANGTMNVGGTLLLYGPLTNSGTINLLGNNGATTILPYYGSTYNYQGGIWNLPGGTINLNGVANNYSIIQSGYGSPALLNQGAIVASPGAQPSVINLPGFTNSGSITALTGTLNLHTVSLQPSGSLNVRLNSQTDYGKLVISGAATLAGAFNATLNSGFVPTSGATFNVLTYGSYAGNFAAFDLPAVVTWQPQYNSTIFALVVGLPQFDLNLSGNDLIFDANGGAPGNQGVLLASPNVALPLANWTPVVTNVFDVNGHLGFTNAMDPNQPHQFFILKFP